MYTFSTLSIKYHKIILNFRKPKKKKPRSFLEFIKFNYYSYFAFYRKKNSNQYYVQVHVYCNTVYIQCISSTKSIIPDREHNLHFCLIGVTSNLDTNPAS